MRVIFHGHACVGVEHGGLVVVIDPGTFSDTASALHRADVLLLTHEHPDHADPAAIGAALARRPGLTVRAPEAAVATLRTHLPEEDGDRVQGVAPGEHLHLGALDVVVGGGRHAAIHPDIDPPAHVTYLVRGDGATLLHPGDSFDVTVPAAPQEARLDVLLAPVSGPWLRLGETIDTVRAVDPHVVVPVHDALLSPAGRALVDRLLGEGRTGGTYAYRPLAVGQALDVAAGGLDGTAGSVAAAVLAEHPEYAEPPHLEQDESVPPRPEEEAAETGRTEVGHT
ncbi:MBL fold metallo-hydrolase [Cellulosimicrobium marinum]|uniref:MBL fold metallo-hydrolase n=1 Tax=Cellulosimicrobium marinum TaxID=1638992 RepID=UPI001E5AAA61|nr:MBL fold metallo-hydrolase [Cellulosimicrobium marinum]MCB7137533.1 MBL fold metallo-hydrolase [Cellulosimicrobium marinum]